MTQKEGDEECYFTTNLPSYVLDREIIINGNHVHRISGFKLAKSSEFFRKLLVNLRMDELSEVGETILDTPRKKSRTKSVCELDIRPLSVEYNDLYGLEYVLSYVHAYNKLDKIKGFINQKLSNEQINSILNAALNFEFKLVITHIEDLVLSQLNTDTVWDFWILLQSFDNRMDYLKKSINKFIFKNFLAASKSVNFLRLEVESVKTVLRHDELDISKESMLLEPIHRWISINPETRLNFCPELISSLRLGRMAAEEFLLVLKDPFVNQTIEECNRLVTIGRAVRETIIINNRIIMAMDGNDLSRDDISLQMYLGTPRIPHSAVFVIGGWEGNQEDPNFGPSRSIQVYNTRANKWNRVFSDGYLLDEGHAYSGCVIHHGKIYIVGGYVLNGPTQALKMFDLQTGEWRYLSPMHEKRNYICAVVLKDKIYAMGGHNGRNRLDSVECYKVDTNIWNMLASMRQVRSDAGAAVLNEKIYIAGGFDGQHFYDSAEFYDPNTNQWTLITPMMNIRSGVALTSYENYLYAIGGNDGLQRLRTVERYDPESGQWATMPSMIRQRSNFCVAVMEGSIYVIGGWSDETNSTISLVEKWTPSQGGPWRAIKELSLPASANCCCTVNGLDVLTKFI